MTVTWKTFGDNIYIHESGLDYPPTPGTVFESHPAPKTPVICMESGTDSYSWANFTGSGKKTNHWAYYLVPPAELCDLEREDQKSWLKCSYNTQTAIRKNRFIGIKDEAPEDKNPT